MCIYKAHIIHFHLYPTQPYHCKLCQIISSKESATYDLQLRIGKSGMWVVGFLVNIHICISIIPMIGYGLCAGVV